MAEAKGAGQVLLLLAVAVAGLSLPSFADDLPPMPRPRPDINAQPEPPQTAPGQESDRQRLIKQGLPGDDGDALMPVDTPADIAKFGTTPRPVTLTAQVTEKGATINAGIVWRIFNSTPDKNGNLDMIVKSALPTPTLNLPPGDYVVHVAYGTAQASDTLSVRGDPTQKTMVLDVGALKLTAAIAGDIPIPPDLQHFDVFTAGLTDADRTLVAGKVGPDSVLALNAGTYHVVSYFGGVNAVERADLRVDPGQLTDATLYQKAAQVSLKLVSQAGGEAIADVDWTIKDKNGKSVYTQSGAFPSAVLEEGDYTVSAQRAGKTYSQALHVVSGKPEDIDVLTGGQ